MFTEKRFELSQQTPVVAITDKIKVKLLCAFINPFSESSSSEYLTLI